MTKTVKVMFFIGVAFLFFNCDKSQLDKLEKENKKLKDSIINYELAKIKSAEMILIPSSDSSKNNLFYGMIVNRLEGEKYNLYQTDTLHHIKGVKKELIGKGYNNSQFEMKANPNYIKQNTLYLFAEYDLDSLKIQIPGVLYLK